MVGLVVDTVLGRDGPPRKDIKHIHLEYVVAISVEEDAICACVFDFRSIIESIVFPKVSLSIVSELSSGLWADKIRRVQAPAPLFSRQA